MKNNLVFGFMDESPSLSDSSLFFCVDVVSTNEKTNKNLQKILKNARRKIVKKKLKQLSELKFYNSDEKTRIYILSQIASCDVEIVVLILDKEKRKIVDTPENYGIVVAAAITELLKFHSSLSLTMDKKFTNMNQQNNFLQNCQKTINILSPKGKNVFFNPPIDSRKESSVQLADFVAGAFNAKYNKKENRYVEIIQKKVRSEMIVKWTEIKKRIMNPAF